MEEVQGFHRGSKIYRLPGFIFDFGLFDPRWFVGPPCTDYKLYFLTKKSANNAQFQIGLFDILYRSPIDGLGRKGKHPTYNTNERK